MLKKTYTKSGKKCRVTFKLPADVEANKVCLVGDFNDWDATATPMKQLKDGSFSAQLSLPVGETYRFRYFIDDQRWENDWEPDGYATNEHGTDDSLVTV